MTDFCADPECWRPVFHEGLCPVCARGFVATSPSKLEPWMLTKTGLHFHFLDPKPEAICIEDIAWALSRKARFNGHTTNMIPYSVAQHCCHAHDQMLVGTENCNDLMWALLHDATEAYLPDVNSTLKDHLSGFRGMEFAVEGAIADRFGLRTKPTALKEIDLCLLATERRDMMFDDPTPWEILEGVEPLRTRITPWGATTSYYEFLYRFGEVTKRTPG